MSKQSGYLVKITAGVYEGKSGIVYHAEQDKRVSELGKVLVTVCEGSGSFLPMKDEQGKDKKILKNPNHLKLIGYTD